MMNCKNWEVGSTWYVRPTMPIYDESIDKQIDAQCRGTTFLSTCRSAIREILTTDRDVKRAFVPAFTCHSVIAPFNAMGIEVIPYPLKKDLSIDWNGLLDLAEKFSPEVILIHGYFGFNTTEGWYNPIGVLSRKSITVIEDLTQTMFSNYGFIASHFKVGSIRKWLPVPDGAFLKGLKIQNLTEDKELSDTKWEALLAKGEYIFAGKGEKSEFMPKFPEAESLLDSRNQAHSMSKLTYALIGRTDFDNLKSIRQSNYAHLVERLATHPQIKIIRPHLDDSEVPFLLPVYIEQNRSAFQKFMAEHNVFPTIIWKCPEELSGRINQDTNYIYDNILCFHVDQRYDATDMERVGDIVDLYFNSINNG
ncbi:MAG: hypothetical protein NC453_29980 [Muribaculum sp.]|nr:hypothetical protein [Muribaculum sp.]